MSHRPRTGSKPPDTTGERYHVMRTAQENDFTEPIMSAPDPEGMSLLGKVIAAGAAVIAPVVGVWKWFDHRMEKKLDKSDFAEAMKRFDAHAESDRTIQEKLFDQIRENEQRAQDRHERLMERLSK